jgi:LmbE family N-acetylglucosaminyl deacetylase
MLWKRKKRASPARFSIRKQRTDMETVPREVVTPFNLRPNQGVLFVHAHPDDETVATGEAIRQSVEAGANVHVAIATDGGETTVKHQNPEHPWDGKPLEKVRRTEGQRAITELGVKPEGQHFFGLPDARLQTAFNRLRLSWKIASVILKRDISVVVTPGAAGFDGHRDHQAVHHATMLAVKALNLGGKKLAVWANNPEGQGEEAVRVRTAEKLAALRHHYSQFPLWLATSTIARNGLTAARKEFGCCLPQCTIDYLSHYDALMYKQETYDRVY